jgi:hypothetical protein
VELQQIPFPIDQPVMPEERQIGRQLAIDRLEARITAAGHQWIIGPRRIGKTSVAKAALGRLRQRAFVALDLDLSKLTISNLDELAGEVARQAQAARVGVEGRGKFRSLVSGQGQNAKRLSGALGELGYKSGADALAVASSVLAGSDDGSPGLGPVLRALALHARATGRNVIVLFDEVHLLATLRGATGEVASVCREEDCPVVFLFAGSEESAVRALRDQGEPLEKIGQEFTLGEISFADWLRGLDRRFREFGVRVGEGDLYRIVEASDGHPRRTMLICSNLHSAAVARGDCVASGDLVDLAIYDARKDRAWT